MKAVFSGFDSAWSVNNRGAIAHIILDDGEATFVEPTTASYCEALDSICTAGKGADLHVNGIDQPLIVPNQCGSRPAEAAFRGLLGRVKGAIQPSNRCKEAMFGDSAPIWPFLNELDADLDFAPVPGAVFGTFAIEIFPAAALIGLYPYFLERKRAPKYNPTKRLFCLNDWRLVSDLLALECDRYGFAEASHWGHITWEIERPKKEDQDKLDAVICALLAYIWRKDGYERCLVAGDLERGYIVTPTHPAMTAIVENSARSKGVPLRAKSIRLN